MKHLDPRIPSFASRRFSSKKLSSCRPAKWLLLFMAAMLIGISECPATEREAIDNARATSRLVQRTYTNVCFRDYFSHGELDEGEYYDLEVNFLKGVTYYLIAGGCDYCEDIDLYVYDGYGSLVVRDNDASKMSVVSFTPTVGGRFTIRVKVYKASASGVHWSLLYGYICGR